MSKYIIELQNISKVFGGVQALDNATFCCSPGEVHTLVGQNGAGKSTLMKILAGVYPPNNGEIIIDNQSVSFSSPHDAQEKGISIIYQELNLIPDLSVAANVFLGHEPKHVMGILSKTELHSQAATVLQRLGVDIDPRNRVSDLTIAQQQMVEIAKALSLNAKVVIMDEPSATLGTQELEGLFKVVATLKDQGVAVIYISHRLEEVFSISDRVTVLRDGKIVNTLPIEELNRLQLVRMMIGSSTFTEQFPPKASAIGKEVVRVENLQASSILHDINLAVHSGEIVGLAGLIGSGRTELAEVLFGVRGYEHGAIYFNGEMKSGLKPKAAIEGGIGYLPEDRKEEGLIMGLSVLENTTLASLKKWQRFGFIRNKYQRTSINEIIDRIRIKTPGIDQDVEQLSGGNQQKVVIAKWLLISPNFIVFNEPTRGVDVGAKVEIWKLIRDLAKNGTAVLMISSEMPEVIGMSDRILVMHKGRIVGDLEGAAVKEETLLTLASFGERRE